MNILPFRALCLCKKVLLNVFVLFKWIYEDRYMSQMEKRKKKNGDQKMSTLCRLLINFRFTILHRKSFLPQTRNKQKKKKKKSTRKEDKANDGWGKGKKKEEGRKIQVIIMGMLEKLREMRALSSEVLATCHKKLATQDDDERVSTWKTHNFQEHFPPSEWASVRERGEGVEKVQ